MEKKLGNSIRPNDKRLTHSINDFATYVKGESDFMEVSIMRRCFCYGYEMPMISAQTVSFQNTSEKPIKIYWLAEDCDRSEYDLPNSCFANVVEPGDRVTYHFKDTDKGLRLGYYEGDLVCLKTVSPGGKYDTSQLKPAFCFSKRYLPPRKKES